jgi:hypothetical protein
MALLEFGGVGILRETFSFFRKPKREIIKNDFGFLRGILRSLLLRPY